MEAQKVMMEAAALQTEMTAVRHELHRCPELGFDLVFTKPYVKAKLEEMGYEVTEMGKAGLVTTVGKKEGKCILIRADMDALPMTEDTDVDFKSEVEGKMHACGHDMHTAMLLGAAKILKAHEDELNGIVKLEFQPAEEIFQGSLDMLESGLLENPHVDAAMMIHVVAGMPMPTGMMMISGGGVSTASCEQYHITVEGKGGHGSTPHLAIDPITAAAQIQVALNEVNARELDPNQFGVFTTCKFSAGNASNVIPSTAEMWGTIRTIDPENKIGEQIKTRITEISEGVAKALRCTAKVEFTDYCPCMNNSAEVAAKALKYTRELIGQGAIDLSGSKPGGGSEDFAFVSHRVPTASMFITAGNSQEGYAFAQHNPKVKFDDKALCVGAAVYAHNAMRFLEEE